MHRHPLVLRTAGAALLLIAAVAPAQSTRPFDAAAFLDRLADLSTRAAAEEQIPTLPDSALGPLYDAYLNMATSDAVRSALENGLPKLHARIRTAHEQAAEAAMRAWYERTGPAIYRAGPHDGSPADLANSKALETIIKTPEDAFALAKAAVDAGSKDPLILYYYSSRPPADMPPEKQVAAVTDCEHAWEHSPYPDARKVYMLFRCAWILAMPSNRDAVKKAGLTGQSQRLFTQAMAMLPGIGSQQPPQPHPEELLMLAESVANLTDSNNDATTFNRVFPGFNKAFPNNAQVLAYAAEFYVHWAWQARGGDVADHVTDDAWQRFGERLDQAEKYARQSVAADPAAPDGPDVMLTVCLGKSYDRSIMEAWFTRAMNADPDNLAACQRKMTYLLPQWFGSSEEVLGFGRECAETGTGLNRIPLILVDAHMELRNLSDDPAAYMKDENVWADIQSAYEKVLSDETGKVPEPRVRLDRALYLKYAAECQQWPDFLTIANRYGDGIDMDAFGGKALFDYYKRKAAAGATKG